MQSHFEEIPREIALQLVELNATSLRTITSLALSSHTLYKMFIGDKLLLDFACSNRVAAENILKRNPDLLFYRGTVKDHSSHTLVNVTPLEIAYGADNVEMCVMALPYLDQIENGCSRAWQLLENRFFKTPAINKNYNFDNLRAIFMNQDDFTLMKEAAYEFQEEFKPGKVHKGKPFDIKFLIDAIRVCASIDKAERSFFGEQCFRQEMFWKLIVGWLERRVPDNYAKLICAGFKKVPVEGSLLRNPYDLGYGDVFYPLDLKNNYRLGRDYGVIASKLKFHRRGVTTVAGRNTGDTDLGPAVDLRYFANHLLEAYNERQLGLANFLELLQQPAHLRVKQEENNKDKQEGNNAADVSSNTCTIL